VWEFPWCWCHFLVFYKRIKTSYTFWNPNNYLLAFSIFFNNLIYTKWRLDGISDAPLSGITINSTDFSSLRSSKSFPDVYIYFIEIQLGVVLVLCIYYYFVDRCPRNITLGRYTYLPFYKGPHVVIIFCAFRSICIT